ncbi:MAG TPA: methionyl-tRNA formyltransferase [Candidatus Paceibacterota bacterium]
MPLFAFFGSSELSVRVLESLESHGLLPALVVTAPDKPRGRGGEMQPNPVKAWALAHEIEAITPTTLKDEDLLQELGNTDWDVFIVAMYGKLIPEALLDMPRRGALNVHPSLLPRFRGPSPVLSAILEDERSTGISIMRLTAQMDAGPVIAQARIELDEESWPPLGSEFETLLAQEGGNMLAEVLPDWMKGEVDAQPQDESLATYTKKFSDEDARVQIVDEKGVPLTGAAARAALCRIHAFDKSPRAHFFATARSGKTMRVIITDATIGNDQLIINKVMPEGKKEMAYEEFLRGGAVVEI